MEEDRGRIHAMDALRASTMWLLIPLHVAQILAAQALGGAWSGAVFWGIHVFRLPLFFVMSGFFLALLVDRNGTPYAIRNRTVRIAIPLVVGILVLVPGLYFICKGVGVALGQGAYVFGAASATPPHLSYLWFLYYLLIIDVMTLTLFQMAPRALGRLHGGLTRLINHWWGFILLAALAAACTWPADNWYATARESALPQLPLLAYYALFFSFGSALYRTPALVASAAGNAWRWLGATVVVLIPAAILFGGHDLAGRGAASGPVHAGALFFYALGTWTLLMALVGLATRYIVRPNAWLRYLADASYWIYLINLLVAAALAGLILRWHLPTAPTYLLIVAGTVVGSLALYAVFVRHTIIGRVLNGPRKRARQPLVPAVVELRTAAVAKSTTARSL